MQNLKKGLLLAALTFALSLFTQNGPASAASLAGTWRGTIMLNGAAFTSTLVLNGNGRFQVEDRSGSTSLQQTGTWYTAGSTLRMTALSQIRCNPGCAATETPPTAAYRVQWVSPNVIHVYDLTYGGMTTYRR